MCEWASQRASQGAKQPARSAAIVVGGQAAERALAGLPNPGHAPCISVRQACADVVHLVAPSRTNSRNQHPQSVTQAVCHSFRQSVVVWSPLILHFALPLPRWLVLLVSGRGCGGCACGVGCGCVGDGCDGCGLACCFSCFLHGSRSPLLLYLAGAGVGRLTVVDGDLVELSNLHRQIIHSQVGTLVTSVAHALVHPSFVLRYSFIVRLFVLG